jgi:lysophospholipase L1-like esterase
MVLLSEVVLRTVFGFAHPVLYIADPACGYLPKPSQNVERFFCRNTLNSYGMRSPEFQMPKPAGTYRVLFIGDSVTYGTTAVPQDQIFTSRLAQSLPEVLHKPVEVLNASTGDWAPENEWGYLKSRGTLDADVVLMVWNTADLFQPLANVLGEANYPTANPPTALGEAWSRYVTPRLFKAVRPLPDPGAQAAQVNPAQRQANLEVLAQAAEFVGRHGAHFAVVYVPSPNRYLETEAHYQAYEQLRAFTGKQKIMLLDLSETFHSASAQALTIDGVHLTVQGQQVVAEELARKFALYHNFAVL